jgi:signal transduction histidine kinase
MRAPTYPADPDEADRITRLARLVTATPGLMAALHLEAVLQQVADLAAEVIEARYAAVGMLAPDGRTLETFTIHGMSPTEVERMEHLPRGHGILGLVIHKGHSVRLSDLTKHPASQGFPANHPPMRPFLGVPILGKRGVIGDLYLTEKLGAEEFSEADEQIARLLATLASSAIENARLHEESARLLEEVQLLQRSRERFFAMVNHELRNSLAAVFGWAEMLVRRKDPATVPRAAFEVLGSAEQAISLINDLLDLSRLDEDRLKPVIREVDCGGVLQQAISRVTPAATSKGIDLKAEVPEGLPSCLTDPHRVEQILVNLLANAIRHSPADSTVRMRIRHEAPEVLFRIEDEGPGIPPDQLERVFDLYETKADKNGEGSGLGLPLSRRLARLLGGELAAVIQDGGGGCFILRLPAST